MKQYKMLLVQLALLLFLTLTGFSQWQSSKVSIDADGCLSYSRDNEQNAIADFSYAGYKNGEEEIPFAEVIVTISPISGDNTDHIQNAIDQVAAMPMGPNGLRGAVLLNAGRYDVWGRIYLNASGVVLRGAGDDADAGSNTIIFARGNTPNHRDVLIAGGGNKGERWNSNVGGNINITSQFVAVGEKTFEVTDASSLQVGDNIIIHHPCSQAWIDAIDGGGGGADGDWSVNSYNIRYNRYIEAINGNEITVKTPIYNHLNRSLSQSYIYKFQDNNQVRNIGVEDLRIDIENSGNTSEDHAKSCLSFAQVEDAWAKNCSFLHFWYSGVVTNSASRITVESCNAINPTGEVDGGRRYNFNCERASSNILFKFCYANYGRHAYTSNGTTSVSGMVIYKCDSEHPYTSSEGHRHWTTGMLFDNFKDYGNNPGRVLGLYNRGDWGTAHGWSNAHSVAWNCDLRRQNGQGQMVVQKPPTAQNYAIGCFGNITGNGPHPGPAGFMEGNNQTGLEPASLYEAQLACRLGGLGLCRPVSASSHDGNIPNNVLDKDFDTRWSAQGDGEYIQFCFDNDSIPLSGLQIAFFNGDQRSSTFDILTSTDGENWITLQSNVNSTGATLELEDFPFSEVVWAKKLRIVGRGNSVNDWNSYTEVSWDTANVAYNNTPHPVPGLIEAEEYNLGGQNVAYYDNTEGNNGGDFRNDDVDIQLSSENGHNIGWVAAGEWLNYSINVNETGLHDLSLRMSATGAGRLLHVQIDGIDVTGDLEAPNTGDYQIYETIMATGIALTAGEHVMTVYFESGSMNLNYLEFEESITTNVFSTEADMQFSIHPNPFSNVINLSTLNNSAKEYRLILVDIYGKEVLKSNWLTGNQQINTTNLKGGVYMAQLFDQEGYLIQTQKLYSR